MQNKYGYQKIQLDDKENGLVGDFLINPESGEVMAQIIKRKVGQEEVECLKIMSPDYKCSDGEIIKVGRKWVKVRFK